MWFLNRTCLTIRAGTWVGLVYVPRCLREWNAQLRKFQSMVISWVQSDPTIFDYCTAKNFWLSIKHRRGFSNFNQDPEKSQSLVISFLKKFEFLTIISSKIVGKEFYVNLLIDTSIRKKSVCLIVWH